MNINLFSSPLEVFAGLMVGILFGFLLQKAGVTKFSTIVGQLLLKDFTVMKVILTAIAVGSFGLYSFKYFFPSTSFIISTTTLRAALIGGGVFGIGMAILGLCPGTCVGALAEKKWDAWFGFAGMIFGAGIYAEIFPWVTAHLKPTSEINKQTLPEYFEISPWIFIGSLCGLVALMFLIDKKIKVKVTAK